MSDWMAENVRGRILFLPKLEGKPWIAAKSYRRDEFFFCKMIEANVG